MTVVYQHFEDYSLNLVWVCDPFRMADLLDDAVKRSAQTGSDAHLTRPLLLDLRQINLMKFEVQEFTRLIWERTKFRGTITEVPTAFVAQDEDSYGMLRLYGAHAEYGGLRSTENFFATHDMRVATSWIFSHLDCNPSDEGKLHNLIQRCCSNLANEHLPK